MPSVPSFLFAGYAFKPKAVFERPDGQAGCGEAKMGYGIQRVSRVQRQLHERPGVW